MEGKGGRGGGRGRSGGERVMVIVREMELRFIQTFNNLSNQEPRPLAGIIISFKRLGRERLASVGPLSYGVIT